MSNLFKSISIRPNFHSVPTQPEVRESCEVLTKTSLTQFPRQDHAASDSSSERLPVKRDLLSFISQKPSEAKQVELKATVADSEGRTTFEPVTLCNQPADQCAKTVSPVDGQFFFQPDDCLIDNVQKFLVDEYGNAFQSQLDVTAVLSTTLIDETCKVDTSVASNADHDAVTQASLKPPASVPAVPDDIVMTSMVAVRTDEVKSEELITDDSECNSDVLNIISAVEEFAYASEKLSSEEHVTFAKQPKLEAIKPSKIEFSVSQSSSSYHKWKSTVSVPDELVRKLPKPAFQPRLPPELAQSHSGPQILRSSLNINFKKPATTKAELRVNSLTSVPNEEQATSLASESSCNALTNEKPPTLANEKPLALANEKPPVKLVIKTLSRESKPQRVVIISCSSSVRREPPHRPNDDSDSDSCGHYPSALAANQTMCSASLSVPQESTDKGSGSSQTNQKGKEHSRSIYFCSMQPTVGLTRVDSKYSGTNNSQFQSFTSSSTWNTLQEMFRNFCHTQRLTVSSISTSNATFPIGSSGQFESTIQTETDMQTVSYTTSAPNVIPETDKRDKSIRGPQSELKRLSDSSGYCAFANMPNKRESAKIAALYQSTLIAADQKVPAKPIPMVPNGSLKIINSSYRRKKKKGSSVVTLSGLIRQSGRKKLISFWHSNRAQRRAKYRHLKEIRSKNYQSLNFSDKGDASSSHTSLPGLLDPLIAASFDRSTGEPTVDHLGRSSLHIAMGCFDNATLAFVTDLYKQKDNLDCKDNEGLTPLYLGCRFGNVKGVELLLAAGASTSCTCPESSNTPLHEAVLQCSLPLSKLLVQFGADLTTRNKQGMAAIDLKTSSDVSEFLAATLVNYSHTSSKNVRILHSDRKLPTVYVLKSTCTSSIVTHYVLKSELCWSLGISPEYFDVHHSESLKSFDLENSVMASRIINPQLKMSFEQSMPASCSSSVVEVDDSFSKLFSEFTSDDKTCVPRLSSSPLKRHVSHPDFSSDTEEMAEEPSEEDECEIRRDDVREINRSLKKLAGIGRIRRKKRHPVRSGDTRKQAKHLSALLITGSRANSPKPSSLSHDQASALEASQSDLSTSTVSHGSCAENLNPSLHSMLCDTSLSPDYDAIGLKCEPQAVQDNQSSHEREEMFPVIARYRLHSYAKEICELEMEPSQPNRIISSNDNNGFAVTGEGSEIHLNFCEPIVPSTNFQYSRRKSHPFSIVSKSRTNPAGAGRVSISCAQFADVGHSSASACLSSYTSKTSRPNSVFKVNTLAPAGNSLQPSKTSSSRVSLISGSSFSSVAVPNSNILCPSAMMRVLKPAMTTKPTSRQETEPVVVNSSHHLSSGQNSLADSTTKSSMTPPRADGTHGAPSVVCFREDGLKVFVQGSFKPVKVLVKPSIMTIQPSAP